MEGPTAASPSASTSPKPVLFPESILNNEDRKLPNPVPSPRSSFPRNILNCFELFSSKPREKEKRVREQRVSERKILRAPTLSTLSLSKMDSSVEAEPYKWPHDKSFDPKTTALVIIDMQKDFCSPGGYMEHQEYDITPTRLIIPRIQALLSAFRTHGFPIYHTREGHRPDLSTLSSRELHRSRLNASGLGIGDAGPMGRLLIRGEKGHEIIEELSPLPGENVIDKPGRSAFQHTEFGLMLRIKGVRNLVVCGVTTDVCVHSTIREANDNGFDCVLVEDCAAASTGLLHRFAVESIKEEGGIFGAVTTSDKILAALGAELGEKANGGLQLKSEERGLS